MRVIRSDGYGSERRDDAGEFSIVTTHQKAKAYDRHYMKVVDEKQVTSPLTGLTSVQQATVSISVQVPKSGWTAAQQAALVNVLIDTLQDSEVTIAGFLNFQA
jgi:hypothetical protein